MVEQLLDVDPDVIKRLRVVQPTLSWITAAAIANACPQLTPDVVAALVDRFER